MIEERLFAALRPLVADRVYPQIVPLDNVEWPAITYRVISTDSNNTVCGETDEDLRVQIDLYSRDPVQVIGLRSQVFEAMRKEFAGSSRITDFDAYEEETKLHRRVLEFYI